jgi:signal transduction histidine kinase/CheY-like chemotaxis protein
MPAPFASAPAQDTAERVLREQVAMLYASSLSSTIVGTLLACVLAGLLYWQLGDIKALYWLALNFALLLRRPLYAAYYSDPQAHLRSAFWARRHWQLILVYSAVWGMAPWFFLPADNLPMTSLMILVMLGLASGGVPAVGMRRASLLSFVLPMVLSLIAALIWQGSTLHLILAALTTVHLLATLDFARHQKRMLTDALLARFENEALSDQLAHQVAATQRVSDEKTRFFAAASHDLRQPLHAIALFGAVLEKDLQHLPQHANATRLMRAVGALGNSLDTMLDVSRLDAGVIVPDRQPTPLNPVFQALNQLFAASAEEKGLQLRLRACPLWVLTDAQLLQRLLANLIENALKYTQHGGVLVVARARGQSVWIDVIDTGAGIASEHLDLIFQEFFQVSNPGRDRAKGLGIGLSIVRRLSALLEHPVQVDSTPGRGSRFRVIVPVASPSTLLAPAFLAAIQVAKPNSPATEPPAQNLPRRVLLIDDEADIGDAMTELLNAHGVQLLAVRDEPQAVAAFTRARESGQAFDALISDYRLAAGVDGLALALRLRQQFSPDLPLLLVTGETAPERLQMLRSAGVPVLFKPVAADALLATLAALQRPAAALANLRP